MTLTPDIAQAAAPSVATSPSRIDPDAGASRSGTTEPNVRVTVIEERGKRIEEVRVRGQLTRVQVRPLGGGPGGYEFLPERELSDDADGRAGGHSAVGKRVWRVLAF